MSPFRYQLAMENLRYIKQRWWSSPEEPFAINLLPECTLAKRILRLSFNFKLKLLVSCSDCLD